MMSQPTYFEPFDTMETPQPITAMVQRVGNREISIIFLQYFQSPISIDFSMGDEGFNLTPKQAEAAARMLLEAAAKVREYNASHA